MTEISVNTPQELAALIEGRSDEEINTALQVLGFKKALDKVFEKMPEAFIPEKAAGQSAVIQYDVSSPEGKHTYQVKVAGGSCTIAEGSAEKPRVTLVLSTPDFLRLVTGKLNGQMAFMQGKLKLSGDMIFAITMQTWFKIG